MAEDARSWTIATWNVNSLRARLPNVLRYLDELGPDVLCLQETRLADAAFPRAAFAERGYHVAAASTGGYAGVAIASKTPIDEIEVGLSAFTEEKSPGRRVACRIEGRWIDTVYVPTRTKIGKVEFLRALRDSQSARFAPTDDVVLAGDFNICFDARDYASPRMISDVAVHPGRPEDLAFRRLVDERLVDCFRKAEQGSGHYTWFPNATWAVKRRYGMRLDYVFASAPLVDRLEAVHHDLMTMSWPRPSDHVPVRVRLRA